MTDDMKAKNISPIYIENLSKWFRAKRGRKVQALDAVSFEVSSGEVFGFLGPNGAGKSTTIKTLMGLIRPSSGRVQLCGLSAMDFLSRKEVGYLPENPSFYDFLTAREYLSFVAASFSMQKVDADAAIQQSLERLDLAVAADRPIRGYSKGMVQRLGLAQTLIHDPQVYILDEPMSGLDPGGRALVKGIIAELGSRGKTVFFSTHITSDVEKICDRLAIIVSGRLQVVTSVDNILQEGVTGYRVLIAGLDVIPDCPCELVNREGQKLELNIALKNLTLMIETVSRMGGTVELVEPRRQDLEGYFLQVVQNTSV